VCGYVAKIVDKSYAGHEIDNFIIVTKSDKQVVFDETEVIYCNFNNIYTY